MKWQVYKEYIHKERWLLAAILFFIVWKFFLIFILWQNRVLPPEPDDSFNYITQIASIAGCSTGGCPTTISIRDGSGYVYLSYRLFFGLLAQVTQLSPQTIYHISFYLGTIFLTFLLVPFLSIFTHNKKLIAWTIFFLSFYHGIGETHGFYWVVPSFFLLLLFLLLFILISNENHRLSLWLVIAALLYTFIHPMSIFLILVIPLYLLLNSFFTHRIHWASWRKALFVVITVMLASYASQHPIINKLPKENSYSLQSIMTNTDITVTSSSETIHKPLLLLKYQTFFKEKVSILFQTYLHWLLPSWYFIIPFLFSFIILLYNKEIRIIALYIAAFIFFISSTIIDPLGYRSAIRLWPMTYVFFAFGIWHGLVILQEKTSGWIKHLLFGFSIFLLCLFFALNAAFSIYFNENMNVRNDYPIEPELIQYINALPPQVTMTYSKEFVVAEMWNHPAISARYVHMTTGPDYIITTNFNKIQDKPRSYISKKIRFLATELGFTPQNQVLQPPSPLLPGYTLVKEFGAFSLYKRPIHNP